MFGHDFIIYSLIGGILGALALAPLGCIMMWKKMSYISDAFSHSALLGIVLAGIFNFSPLIGILSIAILFSLTHILISSPLYTSDIIFGFIANTSLALSIIIAYKFGLNRNFETYLFGDILTLNKKEIIIEIFTIFLVIIWLYKKWDKIILVILNEDIAFVENINPKIIRLEFLLILSVIIAVFVKIFGILLISSMLIIPSLTARKFSSTPFKMVVIASIISILSVIIGEFTAYFCDFPTSPSIAFINSCLFIFSSIYPKKA